MFSTPKTCLFIYAHMDDETILSYGTIHSLLERGCDVNLLCLCGCGRADVSNRNERISSFNAITDSLGVKKSICYNYDLSLTRERIQSVISKHINTIKPDTVFTHINDDLHFEHRLVSECVLLACRRTPDSHVNELLVTTSSSNLWNNGAFNPNVFVDVSKYRQEKLDALKKYSTEIPSNKFDLRSAESVIMWNNMWGVANGLELVEPYKLMFKRGF